MFRWGYWSLHFVFLSVMLDKMQLLQFYQKICQFQKSQQKALKIGMDLNIIEIMTFNWLWMWPSLQFGLNYIRFSRTWSLEPHINAAAYKMAVSHPNVIRVGGLMLPSKRPLYTGNILNVALKIGNINLRMLIISKMTKTLQNELE